MHDGVNVPVTLPPATAIVGETERTPNRELNVQYGVGYTPAGHAGGGVPKSGRPEPAPAAGVTPEPRTSDMTAATDTARKPVNIGRMASSRA